MLAQRTRRSTPNRLTCVNSLRTQDACARTNYSSRGDPGLLSSAHLSSDDCVVFDNDAACESGLGRDYDMLTDLTIVGNVYKVIQLGTGTDHRHSQCGAVDAAVCAYLNIVFDSHRAHLRKLF